MEERPELSEDEWLLARIREIVDDERRLEAHERTQTDHTPKTKDEMRSFAFKQIADLLLKQGIGVI